MSRNINKASKIKLNRKIVFIMIAITILLNVSICGYIFYRNTTQFSITFYNSYVDKNTGDMVFNPISTQINAYAGTNIENERKNINFTKAGHKFINWYTDKNFKHAYTIPNIMPAKNIKLYGKWEVLNYNLTFKYQLGNQVADVVINNITYGTSLKDNDYTLPTTQISSLPQNYKFIKWSSDSSGLLNSNFKEDSVVLSNINVYAIWGYQINYAGVEDATNYPNLVVVNTSFAQNGVTLPTPESNGKTFKGWFTQENGNGAKVTNNTPINSEITLYAYFEN